MKWVFVAIGAFGCAVVKTHYAIDWIPYVTLISCTILINMALCND